MSLNVAARALLTNQSVMQVIGHNIANANTVGYSRQTAQLEQVPGAQTGSGYFGRGVDVAAVERSYNALLTRQANATQTVAEADAVRLRNLQQVEGLFPLGSGSLGSLLNNALNAWVDVKSSPADATARNVVIDRADELAGRIRDASARLSAIGDGARLQSAEVVKTINQLAGQVASLNERIARASGSGAPPNDLLDQRDTLVAELSKHIQITTVGASDGSLTLFVGSSLPLVLGSKAASLSAGRDALDGDHRQVIEFVQGSTRLPIQDEFLVGGQLKGLQDFINKDLTDAQAQLGRMALALAAEVNQQHRSGLDLNGNAGGDFFTVGSLVGRPAVGNTGTASLSMAVADGTALAGSDYEVTYNTATTVTIRRLSDGQVVAGSPAPVTLPTTFEGLTLSLSGGAAAAGDRFLLRPAADAAQVIDVALSQPASLAVASRLSVAPATANTGAATIEGVSMTLEQGSFPATVPALALTFNAGTGQFAVSPAPVLPATVTPANATYTPGQPLSFTYDSGTGNRYTYSLTLRGQPANGDVFNLSQTAAGAVRFNSGNAQALLALRDQVTFDGNVTLADGYVPVFSGVASKLNTVKLSAEFSQAQAATAETQRANASGVNLDEEAAKLIQFQQAYQASARYMQTVQGLFDTLLTAFR